MEHFFDLPVSYQEEELTFRGRLVTFGYAYKFYVIIEGQELVFEKDDEMNYRAINAAEHSKTVPTELIEAVIASLQKIKE